jgi:protein-S-isoprenylcysteine O-methyltransferase Ste14
MKQTSDGLFQHPGLRSFLIKARLPLFIAVLVLLAVFAQREWLLAGFIVSMVGEFIQIWCFASLDKNATLTIRGPYTMVRNPMYLGRFFIPLGFLMLLGQWWLLLAYAVIYWMYMDARVQREEAHLKPIFGAPYEAYCQQVRRFVPGWPQAGTAVAYWNWALFAQNNAGRNLLATLAAWALMAAWTVWGVPMLRG